MSLTRPIAALVLLLATFAGPATAGQASTELPLDEAIRLALAANPTVVTSLLSEARADEELAMARTRRLPQFALETQASRLLRPVDITFPAGAFGVIEGIPIPGSDSTVTTPAQMTFMISASVSQPLTGLVRTRLAVRQGEAAVALARENSRGARLEVVQQVRQVYYAILEAASALDATAANRRLLTELSRVVVTRVAERTALPADRLDVEARLASIRVTELSLENAVATAKERLNRLLGRAIDTPFNVSPLDAMAMDPGRPGASSPADHPAVREAALRTEQAAIAEEQARADRLPDLNLLLQTMTPINIDGAPRNVTAAGVQLKWEPFDWGRKSHAIAARRLDAERADRTRRDVESAAAIAVNQARRAVDYTQATLRAAIAAHHAAREHARVRAAQYETRAALLSDALQAEASLADSADRYHRAVIALLTARADLEYALGEDPVP